MNYHQVFHEKVFPLRDRLYRFALSIVRKNDVAEDVVQEILIKAWDKREEWENWYNMDAMIFTMTRNLSLDKLKSKNNQLLAIPEGYDTPSRGAGPDQRVRSEEHTSELQSRGQPVCRLLLEKKKRKERSPSDAPLPGRCPLPRGRPRTPARGAPAACRSAAGARGSPSVATARWPASGAPRPD